MRGLTPAKIAGLCGGELVGGEDIARREVSSITRDSRECAPGCLFAAIPGARTDGHDHLESAKENGAICALCQREPDYKGLPYVLVDDTQRALGAIAAFYRGEFAVPVVGITGSVGKTSAKEMTAAVLSQRFDTMSTDGNYNNELGVPLTLFRLGEDTEAAVVEMGISASGEMERLTAMVRPNIAVITCVGYSHLEGLGSLEGVLRAKTAVTSGMGSDGVLILNGDDELLRGYEAPLRKVYYGLGDGCQVRAEGLRALGLDGMEFDIVSSLGRAHARIGAFGEHLVYAALAAAAVGIELGLGYDEITAGIAAYRPVGRRSNAIDSGGIVVIDDCYNSNPNSAVSALRSLSLLGPRRVAILGDMLELGADSPALHEAVGRFAGEKCELVLTCGEMAGHISAAAEGLCRTMHYESKSELISALPGVIERGDKVLVKASRGMRFEDISEALKSL